MNTIQHAYCGAARMQASQGFPCLRLQIIPEESGSYVRAWTGEQYINRSFLDWLWSPNLQPVLVSKEKRREIVYIDVASCKERLAQLGIDPREIERSIRTGNLDPLVSKVRETYHKLTAYLEELGKSLDPSTLVINYDFENTIFPDLEKLRVEQPVLVAPREDLATRIYEFAKKRFSFSLDDAKQVAHFWLEYKEVYVERAKEGMILVRASDNEDTKELPRSIAVSAAGKCYILFNKTRLGDRLVGRGQSKVVSCAWEITTGKLFASSSCSVPKEGSDVHFSLTVQEAESMQKLSEVKGVLSVEGVVRHQKKDGRSAIRILTPLSPYGTLNMALQKGRLSILEQEKISLRLLEIIHNLHLENWVHLDIKDDNILIMTGENGEKEPVLADFGFAIEKDKFREGKSYGGSPLYSSPEYLAESILGIPDMIEDLEAHEIWCLGIVFCKIWTRNPFPFPFRVKGRNEFARDLWLLKHSEQESLLKDFRNWAPCWQALIGKMLIFDPKKRITFPEAIQYVKQHLLPEA